MFRNEIDPRCIYCSRGRPVAQGEIGCVYHGVVKEYYHCKRFQYDPLRRIPKKPVKLSANYTDKDFSL